MCTVKSLHRRNTSYNYVVHPETYKDIFITASVALPVRLLELITGPSEQGGTAKDTTAGT